jgi:hypothetical protein
VYVNSPSLFRYDFVRSEELTLGLIEINGRIEGIFGYFYYSDFKIPDIGGMLWKVTRIAQAFHPIAGLALRNFVLSKIPHRFFVSPGAGLDTKLIYERLGLDWIELRHFLGKLPGQTWPHFIKMKEGTDLRLHAPAQVTRLTKLRHITSINNSLFSYQSPVKDIGYLAWKYFYHPHHHYQIWSVQGVNAKSVVVSRIQKCNGLHVMRIVDFFGPLSEIAGAISSIFFNASKIAKLEYVDVVCRFSSDRDLFAQAGFLEVDFSNPEEVVPNYFDPLVVRSIQIYANADPGFDNLAIFRGNGDQDRPNSENNWCLV